MSNNQWRNPRYKNSRDISIVDMNILFVKYVLHIELDPPLIVVYMVNTGFVEIHNKLTEYGDLVVYISYT